jgi:hypothetical protein
VLLVHAGNRLDLANRRTARFPASQVPTVRARVSQLLDTLRPSNVVSAAASGADLIVLEEAIARGIAIHVVLPITRQEFVDKSVADAGPEWVRSFEAVLQHASIGRGSSVLQGDGVASGQWYLAAHDELLGRAMALADGQPVVALTIRPPEGEHPPSGTDEFASRAERMGLLVLSIDPRAGSPASLTVS